MKLTEAISLRIRELCIARNLTADMLIRQADASPAAVAMIISGSDRPVILDDLRSICDVFGITMEELFKCDLFFPF